MSLPGKTFWSYWPAWKARRPGGKGGWLHSVLRLQWHIDVSTFILDVMRTHSKQGVMNQNLYFREKTLVGQWELEAFIEVAEKLLQTDRLVWKIPAEHLLRVPRVLGPAEIARGLLIPSIPSFPLRFETIWLAFPYYVHEGSRYSID